MTAASTASSSIPAFRFSFEKHSAILFLKSVLFAGALFIMHTAGAQNLTLSSSGQTGTSGTNWSTSGTDPVTILTSGSANINTSVIEGYLNAGKSVIVDDNNSVGIAVNSSISKTAGGSATLTIRDVGFIKTGANVSISSSSNALNIIVWSDDDNSQGGTVDDYLYCEAGTTFSSNGGKIVLAGGPDNGTQGGTSGDGIPDGFAWNGSNSSTYGANNVGGLNLGPRGGTGNVISLLSGGGDIILRGATSNNNGYPGITSQGNLKIASGTGRIIVYGKSSSGHGVELTYGASPSISISSSSTSTPAIDIIGTTSQSGYVGFWASNNAAGNILIQSDAPSGGGITIEGGGSSTGTGLWFGVNSTNIITQILSQSGTITLKGHGGTNNSLFMHGDFYMGNRKDATAVQGITPSVTASSANITIAADDQYSYSNTSGKNSNISSTGALTIKAFTPGYAGTVSWTGNNNLGSAFSSITLGDQTENYSMLVNNTMTTTGNITAYNSDFSLADGVGLVSTGSGTITINAKGNFNTNGTTRRTISTVNGNINVFADSDASGNGQLDIDYLTFNPGTGNTTVRCETMNWGTASNTDKPYFNGTGSVTIEPADASFQGFLTNWVYFDQDANGMSGLTIGKITNTGNITHSITPVSVAGSIAMYGGVVTLSANLTSSATGNIFIKSNSNLNGGASLAASASILKTAGTGTLTMQSMDRLNSGTITASGTGVLNVILWSDYDNDNNGGVEVRAVTTNGGHFWLGGSNSNGGSYTWNGLTVGDGPSVGSVNNNYNATDFFGPISTSNGEVLVWAGDGYSSGTYGIAGYTGAAISSGSGDITLIADNITASTDLIITTTGKLTLLPDGGSYPAAITWSGTLSSGNLNCSGKYDPLFINNFGSLGGLVIGSYKKHLLSGTPVLQGNTSNVTISSPISVAGPVSLYGSALTVSQNIASTSAGDISLYGNTLSVAGGVTVSSTGKLVIEPITAATTIGLAGGAGTLAVSATNFSSNFTDGFSEIRIGNSSSGNITLGSPLSLQDNLRLSTAGNLLLNDILTITSNDFRFIGSTIVPASNKFVKTNGTGKLIMDISNNASKLFPLGISYYDPSTITNKTGADDTFYATVSNGVYADGSTGGTALSWSPRVNLTWNIGNTGASTGSGNVDLAFGWNASDVVGTFTAPRLLHYGSGSWALQPNTPVFNIPAGTLTYNGYTGSFSPFTIAESNFSLPVTWLSFTGKKVQNGIALSWSTAAEMDNEYFEVERGSDGNTFQAIGRVLAATNPAVKNEYGYTDQTPLSGTSYYRIKQYDRDGHFHLSTIISIGGIGEQGYHISNVPGSGQLQVTMPAVLSGKTALLIFDANGRQVLHNQLQPGRSVIYTGSLLSGGIYFVKVVQDNSMLFSSRFIK